MSGLSGLSLWVPKPRVPLHHWCEWTGNTVDKVRAVIGEAFRVPAAHEDVYTLAANAVVRLIEDYDIDTSLVGQLILATESSTDNAVGGPTIKGLVDEALIAKGRAPLGRDLESYELKQACLAGLSGLLSATRYVEMDGRDRCAIVVAADIAEYARGSSGEQTQGAGAVAMLVEPKARLLELSMSSIGRSVADRRLDFRKPIRGKEKLSLDQRPFDFPVFNGKYSTHCYLEAVDRAVDSLLQSKVSAGRYLDSLAAIFFHRPYERLPYTALARLYIRQILEQNRQLAQELAELADVKLEDVKNQLAAEDLDITSVIQNQGLDFDPMPALNNYVRVVMKHESFKAYRNDRCGLGKQLTRQLGNLYSASLPAWLGAGFEDASQQNLDLTGKSILLIGYGSGDAALAVEGTMVDGWQEAAQKLSFTNSLADAIDLSEQDYNDAHDRKKGYVVSPSNEIALLNIGESANEERNDKGIPFYQYQS